VAQNRGYILSLSIPRLNSLKKVAIKDFAAYRGERTHGRNGNKKSQAASSDREDNRAPLIIAEVGEKG